MTEKEDILFLCDIFMLLIDYACFHCLNLYINRALVGVFSGQRINDLGTSESGRLPSWSYYRSSIIRID